MYNWFVRKSEIKNKTVNAIMDELESLTDEASGKTRANYWIDNTHNVFAFINDNVNGDKWIEIHYELYDCNNEIIGDLMVGDTNEVDVEKLLDEVVEIVDHYLGD